MASCGGWLVTVRPGRLGKSLARHYDLAARSSPTDPGHAGDGSAAPRPKTATVERREASVPRHGTQGASQAPGVSRHDTTNGCSAEHPNVSRRAAHPSFGVSEARMQTPDAKMRRGNEMGCLYGELFSARCRSSS